MALVVPNAGDTTGGNRFEAIDQAEPDALDFEVLSHTGSGVVSGCEVTSLNSATTVAVSAGTVVLNHVPYAMAAAAALAVPSAPADNRFDLVVVRVTAGTPAFVVLQGQNSSTNPSFPRSASVLTTAPGTNDFNPATDVLLAALYRSGSTAVTSSRITDKRIMRNSSIVFQGTSTPLTSQGNGPGSLYFRGGSLPVGPGSGIWAKVADGSWIELAQNVGSHLPIGAAVAWPSNQPVPAGCAEFNGQPMAVSAYPALFAVYGYTHGGSGGTFFMPDWNNKYLKGTTNTSLIGTVVGADTITLTLAQLPLHSHTYAHTHTYTHTHSIAHDHPSASTASAGTHTHTGPGGDEFLVTDSSSWSPTISGNTLGTGTRPHIFGVNNGQIYPGPTASDGSHSHTVNIPSYTGNTSSQSASTTAGQNNTTTTSAGSSASVDIRPYSEYTRWIARVSLGTDSTSVGAPQNSLREFSMSTSFGPPTNGTSYLWIAAFDCAVRKIRAWRLDGTACEFNVTVDGISVLGTDLATPSTGTWYSSAELNYPVAEDSVIEVVVSDIAGSPTLAHIQVDLVS